MQFMRPIWRKLSCKDLEEAATLLGTEPLVGNVKRYKNRCTLAEWIIMRIVALFPYRCGSCQEDYQVDRLATAKRRCHNCGQESHDCPKLLEADKGKSIPGLVWLCDPCHSKDRLEAFPMEARPSDGNVTESDDEFEDKISPPKVKVDKQKRKKKQKEDLKKHSEEDNIITPVNKGTEVKKRDLSLTIVNEEESVKGGITASSKPPVFENVCEAYKKKQCPHGYSGTKLVDGITCSKKTSPHVWLLYLP